jgi:hypothetical protein
LPRGKFDSLNGIREDVTVLIRVYDEKGAYSNRTLNVTVEPFSTNHLIAIN